MKKPTYGFKREIQFTTCFRNGYRTFHLYKFKTMTVTVLVVDKTGSIKEQIVKHFDVNDLYKKAGLKKAEGFKKQTEWSIPELHGSSYNVCLYAKANGRANSENKYEFPPPVDNILYFGSCILVNKNDDDEYTDLSKTEWKVIYDFLYGGFDDIGDEEEEEEDDDDDVPRTKSGYVKDEFVVDDDDADDDDEEEDEEDEEDVDDDENTEDGADEEEPVTTRRKSTRLAKKSPVVKKTKGRPPLVNNFIAADIDTQYLECTGELSEEEYV